MNTSTKQKGLAAEKLKSDSRVKEAKKLLCQALDEAQKEITTVKKPSDDLKASYEKLLEEYAKVRGGKLWYPYLGTGIGNGPLVELGDGSVKYDFICGIGPHYFGHSHHKICEAMIDGALQDTVMQGHLQQNHNSFELCKKFCDLSGFDHCFLSTSGAMANENALKIVFQNRHPAKRILAFEKCFMGRTVAISQITDKPKYRVGLPTSINVDYIPFYDPEKPEESTERTLRILKSHLSRYPGEHAAMVLELVQGEGGFNVGTKEFFRKILHVLKEHNICSIADEVQSFGRTPSLFAFQYFELDDLIDIVTVGKLSQVCATLYKNELKPAPGLLSQTFTASGAMIEASLEVLNELSSGDYYGEGGKIQAIHHQFVEKFEAIRKKDPSLLHGPYGLGAMIAFTPYEGEGKKTLELSHKLFEAGVICFCCGENPMRIRFLPPAPILEQRHIDEAMAIVEKTLIENKA